MKKTSMTIMAVGILIAIGAWVAPAEADKPTRCDYSYLADSGDPDIGEDGKVEYGKDWGNMIKLGFQLKHVVVISSGRPLYIFELCK